MFSKFKPTWMFNNIYAITPEFLKANKITTILTDLDNTLIPWDTKKSTHQLKNWLIVMHNNGIQVIVISNNSFNRVNSAIASLNVPFISRALKPLNFGIKRAIKNYNLNPNQVIMVGDQLMTDILASNNSGVKSILVKPLVASDAWNTKPNRMIEHAIWKQLYKKYPDLKWR